MARQEVEASAELWFITARDPQHVADILADPRVALTFSSSSSWVAATASAEVVDDLTKLTELEHVRGAVAARRTGGSQRSADSGGPAAG